MGRSIGQLVESLDIIMSGAIVSDVVSELLESPRDIFKAAKEVTQNVDKMDRWMHFVRTAFTNGYTPQVVDGETGKVFNIRRAGYGNLPGTPNGLLVMPVDAKLVTDERTITPIMLRKGDFSPTFDKSKAPSERAKTAKAVDRLRKLGHDI